MDGLVKQARIAQFDKKTVRIVFDLASLKKVKIFDFNLPNQYKIVVDILGQEIASKKVIDNATVAPTVETRNELQQSLSLAKSLGLKVQKNNSRSRTWWERSGSCCIWCTGKAHRLENCQRIETDHLEGTTRDESGIDPNE